MSMSRNPNVVPRRKVRNQVLRAVLNDVHHVGQPRTTVVEHLATHDRFATRPPHETDSNPAGGYAGRFASWEPTVS